ncbi:hypothetical protein SAMN05216302_101113 [Nitrosomonas aestuarii]|uniref:Uncharacterized protein n=1 Tax=Nitrosomonas aestuarii TaxID=52441 RepID=A0A1I4B654_9PROT|nr:hypothetical protein [Nitrosomonas aestuarii]SFK63346.1 hypothetical protein SAMN05216302_101113 [Nitrosomonas aestuarii]
MKRTEVRQTQLEYNNRQTQQVDEFATSLRENAVTNGVFDSAAANDIVVDVINKNTVEVPESLQVVLDEARTGENDGVKNKNQTRIIRAIYDGMNIYESQHGVSVPADVIEHAIHMAYGTTGFARDKMPMSLDSATSAHHDQLSLQPNRAVVAILSALGESIPFAHYLPADISSNEAKLAILTHQAGDAYGMYAQGGSMDGVNCGNHYIDSSRIHALTPAVTTGNIDGKLTTIQATDETCDQGAAAVKLLRGRTILYVNGIPVAQEAGSSGSGNSVMTGSVEISSVTYNIGGNINTDTGVFAITTTPALPDTVPVAVEGFIDYERDEDLIPRLQSGVVTYPLFAKASRGYVNVTPDARSQMSNELGLDPLQESMVALQQQVASERHYRVLAQARRLSVNNQVTFNYDWSNRKTLLNRAEAWRDLSATLGALSQQMAIDTFDHGITHLYIGKYLMADFLGMPSDIFVPSGVTERPGIFRVGRLFGRYDVYYTPKGLTDTTSTAQILCIGRASSVALNPFVLGDAVPTTLIPLGVDKSLKNGTGYYARNFTAVNPHIPSAMGCAVVNVTNIGQ